MERLLNDTETYQLLNGNPSRSFKEALEHIIKDGMDEGFLSKQEARYLVPMVSKIPVIYYLPKIHKDSNNPPGRPIVSGIESLTSRLGEYIDIHLQPLVAKTKAYLKDTKHTLQLLDECSAQEDIIMVTGDVSSLYTNIDHEGALKAVEWALRKESLANDGFIAFILRCLDFYLRHNFFWYDNTFYLQTKGVAMGAKIRPQHGKLIYGQMGRGRCFKSGLRCYFTIQKVY